MSESKTWTTTKRLAADAKHALGAREVVLVAVFDDGSAVSIFTDEMCVEIRSILKRLLGVPTMSRQGSKDGGTP